MKQCLVRMFVPSILVLVVAACNNSTAVQPIAPIVNQTERAQIPSKGITVKTREPKAVTLPTPQVQPAPNGYYQDDNGLRLAIAQVKGQMIPNTAENDRGSQYVVLTLTLTNYADPPKDVTGLPFAVWLLDNATSEEFAPEISAPYTNGLWDAIEKLNTGTAKKLGKNQMIRGELFFKTPLGADKFDLVWQPDARRRWVLQVPTVR